MTGQLLHLSIPPLRGLLNHVNTKHVWFMLSISILVSWIQIACLVFVEEDGCKLSNDCFTMHVVLTLSNLIGHVSLKCHVKSNTNMIDSFCSISEKQEKIYPSTL